MSADVSTDDRPWPKTGGDGVSDRIEEVFVGRLGWSNHHVGLEFYEPDVPGGKGSRWTPRRNHPKDPTGLLLQDQIEAVLGHVEGAAVVVVVIPGRLKMDDAEAFASRARAWIRAGTATS